MGKGLILQFYSIKIYLEVYQLCEVMYIAHLVLGNGVGKEVACFKYIPTGYTSASLKIIIKDLYCLKYRNQMYGTVELFYARKFQKIMQQTLLGKNFNLTFNMYVVHG